MTKVRESRTSGVGPYHGPGVAIFGADRKERAAFGDENVPVQYNTH